ncbi:VOC family protein [Sphingobium sp. MK2]|uniref:VOC family protein n=1 Tax=Sphingobium sp. MK2 TaxID=3116540 RepID=UPI0032E367B7
MQHSYDVGGLTLDQPFRAQRLGHIGLSQVDPAACDNFYRDELGFRSTDAIMLPGMPAPAGYFTGIGTDHHTLANIAAFLEGDAPGYAKGVTVNQISFQVGTLEEVANANAFFAEADLVNWRFGRDSPGSNWANYVFDPDGFRVEMYYGMEQVGWDRRSKPLQLFTAPDYVPNLPEPAEISEVLAAEAKHGTLPLGYRPDEPMPFEHNLGGVMVQRPFAVNRIGPVHILVEDLAVSERFYTEKVGLTRTEEVAFEGGRAVFLRLGTDHHVIGLFELGLRDAIKADPRTRLGALGIELGSYRQLRAAVAWLSARGHAVWTDCPQALRPGIEHAAFLRDPGGHTLMLYCGIEQIGWSGEPRPAADRPVVDPDWPETLRPTDNRYSTLTRQGPIA